MSEHRPAVPSDFDAASVRSADGTSIAYLVGGPEDARPLVLVHGWAQAATAWGHELLSELAETFRVVAVDLRGHGHSGVPADAEAYHDPEAWAADLAAVRADAGLDEGPEAILLGWSYGGIVCADHLARRGADGIAALVLCGAVTGIGRQDGAAVGPAMLRVADGAFDDDPKKAISALASFGTAMMRGHDGAGQQRMFGLSLATPPAVRAALLMRRVDNDATLAALDIPVLVLHGADDGVVLPKAGRANAGLAPRGRYVEFDECAHAPFLEQQGRFLAEVRGLAEELDAAGR